MEKERKKKKIEDKEYSMDQTLTEYIVEEGIEEIGNRGIRKIRGGAFQYCEKIEEIILKEGVEEIGYSTFNHCSRLKHVVLVKGMRKIGNFAFGYAALTHFEMNEGLEEVGEGIFVDCKKLKTVSFPLHKIKDIHKFALRRHFSGGLPIPLETLILRTTYQRHPLIPFPRITEEDDGQLVRFIEAQQETYLAREVRISRNMYYSLFVLKYTHPFVYNFDRMNIKKAGAISKRIFAYWFRGFWYRSTYPIAGAGSFQKATRNYVFQGEIGDPSAACITDGAGLLSPRKRGLRECGGKEEREASQSSVGTKKRRG